MVPANMPRIHCAVCDNPVDRTEVVHLLQEKVLRIEVWCHGAQDSMEINARDMSPDMLAQLHHQRGVAFMAPPTLTNEHQHLPGLARLSP